MAFHLGHKGVSEEALLQVGRNQAVMSLELSPRWLYLSPPL